MSWHSSRGQVRDDVCCHVIIVFAGCDQARREGLMAVGSDVHAWGYKGLDACLCVCALVGVHVVC